MLRYVVDNTDKFLYYSIFFPVDIISVCCLSGYDRSQFVSSLLREFFYSIVYSIILHEYVVYPTNYDHS